MIIGIDIGGSTTKIIGLSQGKVVQTLTVVADHPVASASGAMGKFLNDNGLSFQNLEKIRITGVGASFLGDALLGFPVEKVDEFIAIGHGGLFLSGLSNAIIVSMGTGTAFVKAHGKCIRHMGGTGVGGGTIAGLAKTMTQLSTMEGIMDSARQGRIDHIDLSVGELSGANVGNLPSSLTASNFGKMNDLASKDDINRGILNMVYQVVGMMAIFAARIEKDKDIVMSGKLVDTPLAIDIFNSLSDIYGVNFHIPEHAAFCTAIGAAIAG